MTPYLVMTLISLVILCWSTLSPFSYEKEEARDADEVIREMGKEP